MVQQIFKGNPPATVKLTNISLGYKPRWFSFDIGEQYVIYDWLINSMGPVIFYTRTRHLSVAEDDLTFLNNLPPEGTGGNLFGQIKDETDDQILPIKLTIEGNGKLIQVDTDEKGRYEIRGLEPGVYSVKINVAADYYTDLLTTKIYDRGCSQVSYTVYKKVKVINLPE